MVEMNCDQPDGPSCQAAGCVWTYPGCESPDDAHPCYRYNQVVCSTRDECVWSGDHCAPDPGSVACGELNAAQCAGQRGRCFWDNGSCAEQPMGPCPELNEGACGARADCRAVRERPDGCGPVEEPGDNNRRARPPEENCDPVFVRCEDRVIDCADVPIPACEATPGCTVVEARPPCAEGEDCPVEQQCVPEGAPACGARDRETCEMDAACMLRVMQDCGPQGGRGEGGRPPQDDNNGFDRLVACPEVWECVPAENPPCEFVPIGICEDRDDCEVRLEEVCDCGPGADDEPPMPDRPMEDPQARRRPPPPDEPGCPCREVARCVSSNDCAEHLVEDVCELADGCFWGVRPGCDCAMADPAPPCPPGDPDCGRRAPPPPNECPPECYTCLPDEAGGMNGGEMDGVPVDREPPAEEP